MRGCDHAAAEGLELALHDLGRVRVDVVRRLVEQQQVRPLQRDAQEVDAHALAAREPAERSEAVVVVEPERADAAHGVVASHRALVEHDVERRAPQVERQALLRHQRDAGAVLDAHAARRRLLLARQQAQQRRLADAVRTDQRDAVAALEHEVDRADAHALAVADLGSGRLGHHATARIRGEGDRERAVAALLGALDAAARALQQRQARARTRGELRVQPRPLAVLEEDLLLPLDLGDCALVLALQPLHQLRPLLEVEGVGARVEIAAPVGEVERLLGGDVEQGAIVAHEHGRAAAGARAARPRGRVRAGRGAPRARPARAGRDRRPARGPAGRAGAGRPRARSCAATPARCAARARRAGRRSAPGRAPRPPTGP